MICGVAGEFNPGIWKLAKKILVDQSTGKNTLNLYC